MRLHRLSLAAIGPFADPVEVDLDTVSASGLFLLEGPTGAGKSTLIDAIVFALYGDVAAQASSTDRMASAVAAPGVTPEVELDFSTSHGLFRIQRTPKHERRKRRGTGTTTQQASAKLWRLISPTADDAGEPVSTRIDEIGAEIVDIVGLSREQFVQTVVLPQGEFATFLRSDAEHRRALLQRLFGTDVYERTVTRLVEQRRVARQQRSDATAAVHGSVRAYCGAAALDDEQESALLDALDNDPAHVLVMIGEHLDTWRADEAAADVAARAASVAAEQARTDLERCQRQERVRARLVAAREQLASLEATEAEHQQAVERLRAADDASALGPLLSGLQDAEARVAGAEAELSAARAQLAAPDLDPATWSEVEVELRSQMADLEPIATCEQELPERRVALKALRAERTAAAAQHQAARDLMASTPRVVAELRQQLASATLLSAQRSALLDRQQQARQLVADAHENEAASSQLASATMQLDRARRDAHELLANETQLRARFIDGLAGQLASELQPGSECPVCGSLEHPNPARPGAEAVDRETVGLVAEQAKTATATLERMAAGVTSLTALNAELTGKCQGFSTADAKTLCAEAEAAVAATNEAVADVQRLGEVIATAEQQLAELTARSERQAVEVGQLDSSIEAAAAGLSADEQRVAEALHGGETVAARLAALRVEVIGVDSAIAALTARTAAQADLDLRQKEWLGTLDASPFTHRDEVRAALVTEATRAQLRELIDARIAARAESEAALRSPELADLDTDKTVDLDAATAASITADTARQQAEAVRAGLAQRREGSTVRAGEVQTSLTAERAVQAATVAVIRMADLASASTADNARSMTLPTFVLRERFVDVVASANDRLATMSDGRYRLEHVEGKRGNKRSGLELQVRDSHTEHPRDPATLSGGESFYCSLALALGLADVVTSEAGGVDLGTLFVDEGFGSLDADTLEHVLEVLHGLASNGRAVGIVSHVPELKEQITERISVVPNRDGSSRLVVAA